MKMTENWNDQVRIYHLHHFWLRWLNTREGWFWSEELEALMMIIIWTLWPLRRQGASHGQEGTKRLENNKWWLDWHCKFLIITKLKFVWTLYCRDHSIWIAIMLQHNCLPVPSVSRPIVSNSLVYVYVESSFVFVSTILSLLSPWSIVICHRNCSKYIEIA